MIKYHVSVTAKASMSDFDAPALVLAGYWGDGKLLVVDSIRVEWTPGEVADAYAVFAGRFRLASGALGKGRHTISLTLVKSGPERDRAAAYVNQIIREWKGL